MAYSHLASASAPIGFDFSPAGFLASTLSGTATFVDATQHFLFFSTNVGQVHVGGISAVLSGGHAPGTQDAQNFYAEAPPDNHGNPQHYSVSKSQSVSLVYFHTQDVIFNNDFGSGGSPIQLGQLLGTRVFDLLSSDAVQHVNVAGGTQNDTIIAGPNGGSFFLGAGNDFVAGSAVADTIIAGGGNDVINGHEGNDSINGQDGNDTIDGGPGNDNIDGGAGNDHLVGQDGSDFIFGGDGNDTITGDVGADNLSGQGGDDQIDAGDGADTVNGGDGNDTIIGREGSDVLSGGNGDDQISAGGFLGGSTGQDFGSNMLFGDGGDDELISWLSLTGASPDTLDGGTGTDTYFVDTTPNRPDVIVNFEQNERAFSGVDGDPTRYIILSSNTGTIVNFFSESGSQIQKLATFSFQNRILPQDLTIDKGLSAIGVTLEVTQTRDDLAHLTAFARSLQPILEPILTGIVDRIKDKLVEKFVREGARVASEFILDKVVHSDALTSIVSTVLTKYQNIFGPLTPSQFEDLSHQFLENFGTFAVDRLIDMVREGDSHKGYSNGYLEAAKFLTLPLQIAFPAFAEFVQISSEVDRVIFTAIDVYFANETVNLLKDLPDSSTGQLPPITIPGLDGKTTYLQRLSDIDSNLGSDGSDDKIYSEVNIPNLPGNVEKAILLDIDPSHGSQPVVLVGNDLDNTLVGNAASNQLSGGNGNDLIDGGGGNDTLSGDGGDDTLVGGRGDDRFLGGPGSDTFVVAGNNTDIIEDFSPGVDKLDLRAYHQINSLADVITHATQVGSDLQMDFGSGSVLLLLNVHVSDLSASDFLFYPPGQVLFGDATNDVLTGTVGDDVIVGQNGDDLISGGAGDDRINAGDGNDIVFGGDGNDIIGGGSGDDTIVGQDGDDVIFGEGGIDQANGGAGDDIMLGGLGNDTFGGGAGNDVLLGGDGDDLLFGEDGVDNINGEFGNDGVVGGPGDDILGGGEGNDIVVGDDGNDVLFGEAGNDSMNGGFGNDILIGSDGDDVLGGGAGDDDINGGFGNDTLFGENGNDILNGSADNDILIGGGNDDTFVFQPGDGADTIADFFVGGPEDRIWFKGTDLHSFADVQAHATTLAGNTVITYNGFFTVTLNGVTAAQLTAGDFIFT